MIEEPISISTPDGASRGVLCRPDDAHPRPGVIHLTDIGGIRPAHLDLARRLAALGYAVLVPDIFYRTAGPAIRFPINMADAQTMQRLGELRAPLTPEAVARDVAAYVDCLAAHASVRAGPLGVVGYCLTGSFALRAAAARPDRIGAAASFHGSRLWLDTPDGPHLLLPRVKARLYFAHAVQDRNMSVEAIVKLDQALAAWGGRYESETYAGALHGWTTADGSAYDPVQAGRAFQKLSELFGETLKP